MPSSHDQFERYLKRLAGEAVPCQDGDPQSGFYRLGTTAVAIWRDEAGRLLAYRGERFLQYELDILQLWDMCHPSPVPQDVYDSVQEGGLWPDQDPVALSVLASDVFLVGDVAHAIEALEAQRHTLPDAAPSDEEVARACHMAQAARFLETRADELRKQEKAIHLEAAKAVDSIWVPLRERAARLKTTLKIEVIEPHLAHRQAEAKARAQADTPVDAEVQPEGAGEAWGGTVAPDEALQSKPNFRGIALRRKSTIVIEDARQVLRHLAERNEDVPEEIVAVLAKWAKAALARGATVPGVAIRTEQRVA